MKVKTEDFIKRCGCRSVGECSHDYTVEIEALNALVDQFAAAMKTRLMEKYARGWSGWDDEAFDVPKIRDRIYDNLFGRGEKGAPTDPIDVANLAAFWWNKL